ncbi:uncharacterized protein LOC134833232 [Culicoides brevitarsis]|uniref:uncharacterized protein LOC134833232 n=1 Tax=Culicoides brevitarsis TaxID=469753 RepID=UPI00307C5B58
MSVEYDPVTKIWKGPEVEYAFGNKSVAEVGYAELLKDLNHVCQISDDTGEVYTNERMLKASVSFANGLKAAGIKKGDVIIVLLHNHHYLLPTWFGAVLAGVILCPFHYTDTAVKDDLPDILRKLNPKLMVTSYLDLIDVFNDAFDKVNIKCPIYVYENEIEGCHDLKPLFHDYFTSFEEFKPATVDDPEHDTFVLILSSATTGKAKLIKCTHKQLLTQYTYNLRNITFISTALPGWQSEFIFGIGCLLNNCLRVTRHNMTIDQFLMILDKYKAFACLVKPKDIFDILKSETIKKVDLSSLVIVVSSGHHLSPELNRQFQEYVPNGIILSVYGTSELGGGTTEASQLDPDTPNLVGRVKQNFQYYVLNEEGERVGPGEVGELCYTSTSPFVGYFEDEEASKKSVTKDGFFYSGDRGYLDVHGNVFLQDRKKYEISYRGKALNQWDVEKIILEKIDKHAIRDVCVVDIESKDHGMMPIIAIVPGDEKEALSEAEIIQVVMKHHPFEFETKVFFFDKLPMTISGKHKKYLVREMVMEKIANGK